MNCSSHTPFFIIQYRRLIITFSESFFFRESHDQSTEALPDKSTSSKTYLYVTIGYRSYLRRQRKQQDVSPVSQTQLMRWMQCRLRLIAHCNRSDRCKVPERQLSNSEIPLEEIELSLRIVATCRQKLQLCCCFCPWLVLYAPSLY